MEKQRKNNNNNINRNSLIRTLFRLTEFPRRNENFFIRKKMSEKKLQKPK